MKSKPVLKTPINKRAVCEKCKRLRPASEWANNKCLREGSPELVIDDLHKSGHYITLREGIEEFYWPYCANFRCKHGKKIAERNLTKAKKTKQFKTVKTPEGKVVKGADASSVIKKGFVDENGGLYIYHDHEPSSKIVMPTGQRVKG